jgi:hypothetical protein
MLHGSPCVNTWVRFSQSQPPSETSFSTSGQIISRTPVRCLCQRRLYVPSAERAGLQPRGIIALDREPIDSIIRTANIRTHGGRNIIVYEK